MKPRVCVCCGEPMAENANALSRNPNMCASCSSLADGMEELESERCGGPASKMDGFLSDPGAEDQLRRDAA